MREEKISALENLNGVVDGKNRAVEILKKLEVMREVERVNKGEMLDEEEGKLDDLIKGAEDISSMSKASYL